MPHTVLDRSAGSRGAKHTAVNVIAAAAAAAATGLLLVPAASATTGDGKCTTTTPSRAGSPTPEPPARSPDLIDVDFKGASIKLAEDTKGTRPARQARPHFVQEEGLGVSSGHFAIPVRLPHRAGHAPTTEIERTFA